MKTNIATGINFIDFNSEAFYTEEKLRGKLELVALVTFGMVLRRRASPALDVFLVIIKSLSAILKFKIF